MRELLAQPMSHRPVAHVAAILAVYACTYWLYGVHPNWLSHTVTAERNVHVDQAKSWLEGRLHLSRRHWDTSLYERRAYSYFPPAVSILLAPAVAFWPDGVPTWFVAAVFGIPIVVLAYRLFALRTGSILGAAVLTMVFVHGTSLSPVLFSAVFHHSMYEMNSAVAQIGVLLALTACYSGRGRGLGALGLVAAALSRQLTIFYAIPLLWTAWRAEVADDRRRRTVVVVSAVGLVAAVTLTFNWLRFDDPLDTGYARIYEGRDDHYAVDVERGVFSPVFVPRNFYQAAVALPEVVSRPGRWFFQFAPGPTAIWIMTPMLAYLAVDARRIWRDRTDRAVLIAAGLVFAVQMLYHTAGEARYGLNRYSTDYVVALLAIIAPRCWGPTRRWFTFALAAWSVLYFAYLTV